MELFCLPLLLMKSDKLLRKPTLYVPIGGVVVVSGVRYRCVARPVTEPIDACIGCAFYGCSCPPRLQCSKFVRRDRRFVWFVKVDG